MSITKQICRLVERKTGRTMVAASDFTWLSDEIKQQTNEYLSDSTLMRVWGYRPGGSPQKTTLDILSRYLGYADVVALEKGLTSSSGESVKHFFRIPQEEMQDYPHNHKPRRTAFVATVAAVLLFLVGGAAARLWPRAADRQETGQNVLHLGDRFSSYEDYLRLFGITDPQNQPWSQPLPRHQNIIIFGGQYHHPRWGNEGDAARLLPTRTERWHCDTVSPAIVAMQNRQHYYAQCEINRLAITFMRDLPDKYNPDQTDTCFIFCGVYRISLAESDTTHVVWERVAEDLDLSDFASLERLRN